MPQPEIDKFINYVLSKLMDGKELRDSAKQTQEWWSVILGGLLSGYNQYSKDFVNNKLGPYI